MHAYVQINWNFRSKDFMPVYLKIIFKRRVDIESKRIGYIYAEKVFECSHSTYQALYILNCHLER